MHWYTFAANMARAIALVTAINVSLAVLLIFLARRERLSSLFCEGKNPGDCPGLSWCWNAWSVVRR